VPPRPVAVSVYVEVTLGDTAIDPFTACGPRPLSIVTLVAFVVVQESVEDCPADTVEGFAMKVLVGGGFTVTVADADWVPPGPVAVTVYVVVADGMTPTDPLSGRVPIP